MKEWAGQFSKERFQRKLREFVEEKRQEKLKTFDRVAPCSGCNPVRTFAPLVLASNGSSPLMIDKTNA